MATKLTYVGPPDQMNRDVAAATGDGRMNPGRTIEVDAELADLLTTSSDHYERVRSLDDLSTKSLRELARDAGVPRYSRMGKEDLVAALRGPSAAGDASGTAAAQPDASGGPGDATSEQAAPGAGEE